jgi:hypothetical protein
METIFPKRLCFTNKLDHDEIPLMNNCSKRPLAA